MKRLAFGNLLLLIVLVALVTLIAFAQIVSDSRVLPTVVKAVAPDTSPKNWTQRVLGFLLPERLFNRRRKHEEVI